MQIKIVLLSAFAMLALFAKAQTVTGLLGAFPPELVLLQQKMLDKKDTLIQRIRFTVGSLGGQKIVLAQTGVGKVNAAITTTLMIEHFNPARIIFSGIAGGLDSTLGAGDIVIATQVAYHDYGVITDTGMHYGPTKNAITMQANPLYFQCDSSLISKAVIVASTLPLKKLIRSGVPVSPVITKGIIVTGDVFVSAESVTQRLRNEMHASATEMEGAAVAQTCYQQNIPFLAIRSLSDKANNKAKNDMMNFMQVAAANAATLVMAIVAAL